MMNNNEQEPKKPLTLSRPGRLELKKTVEAGQVRQSFPHGRSKTVTVEVKRKRTYAPGAGGRMTEVQEGEANAAQEDVSSAAEALFDERGHPHRHLTAGERATRLRALEDAKGEEERRRQAEAEARQRAAEQARREAEERARREAEEAARQAEQEAAQPAAAEPEPAAPAEPEPAPAAQAPAAPAAPAAKPQAKPVEIVEEE